MIHVAGLILAAGAGTRYGKPKANALLPDGRAFLAACAQTLHTAGIDPIAATVRREPPALPPLNVLLVELPDPDVDMFGSIQFGLLALTQRTGWDRVIILPVDHPLVTAATIRALAATPKPAAIATWNGRHGHPICVSRNIAEDIALRRHTGPTLREVLKDAEACDVPVDDPGIRSNCNTPKALREAWSRFAARGPK